MMKRRNPKLSLLCGTLVMVWAITGLVACAGGVMPEGQESASDLGDDNADSGGKGEDASRGDLGSDADGLISPEPDQGAGQDVTPDAPPEGKPCEVDGHCPQGELCVENLCQKADCREDADCASLGETCQSNLCTPDRSPVVQTFAFDQAFSVVGQERILRWEVQWADRVRILANPDSAALGEVDLIDDRALVLTDDVSFTLEASNAAGTVSAQVGMSLTPPLDILNPSEDVTLQARQGESFTASFEARGGALPTTWSLEGELPAGVSFDPVLAVLQGSPEAFGTWEVDLSITDALPSPQSAARRLTLVVAPPPLSVLTQDLPEAVQGETFRSQLEATGGAPPYTWSLVEGAPPSAIVLTGDVLEGVASNRGLYTMTFEVMDSAEPPQVATQTLVLPVVAPPLSFVTQALPVAQVGEAYALDFEGAGGVQPYQWIVSGVLPEGIILNNGSLRGTPTAPGATSLTVQLRDAQGQEAVMDYRLEVSPAPLVVVTRSLPQGRPGSLYEASLEGQGGVEPYTWSATGLPPGLSVGAEGLIAGVPGAEGEFQVSVVLRDAQQVQATRDVTLVVSPAAPVVTTASLPPGRVGEAYDVQLTAQGGEGSLVWSWDQAPAGLGLSAQGRISGTPQTSGAFTVDLTVTDEGNQSGQASFSLEIAPPQLVLVTATLAPAVQGQAYSAQLEATGGFAPLSWSLVGGTLPAGLSITTGGLVSGAPSNTGSFSLTVQVADGAGQSAQRVLALEVQEAPVVSPGFQAIAGSLIDLGASGDATVLPLSEEDDAVSEALPLGFDFVFYGQTYSSLYVNSNGLVMFTAPTAARLNTGFPSASAPAASIAVFWDDLDPGDGGEVLTQVLGTAPNRRFVVQWRDVDFFSGNNARVNAELILYEGTHQVQLLYGASTGGTSTTGLWGWTGSGASAGMQDETKTRGVELAVDQEGVFVPGQVWLLTPQADTYTVEGWSSPSADFVPIDGTGTLATLITGDDTAQSLPIGFDFSFYGDDFTDVFASSNGLLSFEAASTVYFNTTLPSASTPNGVIAAFWDDLLPSTEGQVHYQTLGDAPWRRFVVQWTRMSRIGDADARLTFQAVLHETSHAISVHYGPMSFGEDSGEFGGSATVGLENAAGDQGLAVSFNQAQVHQGDVVWMIPKAAHDTSAYRASELSTSFVDIRRVGRRSTASDLDDGAEDISLGFTWDFYGQSVDTVSVGSNGWIAPGGGAAGPGSYINREMPDSRTPNGLLAPFWDDLDPPLDGGRGAIYTFTRGVAPLREFVVQWQEVPHNNLASASLTFQAVVRESGEVVFYYGPMFASAASAAWWNGSSATIGVESPDGALGSQHSFEHVGAVKSGGQVRLIPREP